MLQKTKFSVGQWLNSPNARAIFILGTMLLAALIGGAPNDHSGGG
jgi:hypothetical protein